MSSSFELQQFQSPSKRYRPKMRWWLPGAYMNNDEIKREIEWLSKAGYGGAEIIHFFGIPSSDVAPEQYDRYGFGGDEWNDRMKAALETAIPLGFQLDFTVGPLWPIATPLVMDKEDERCTQGLHIAHVTCTTGYRGSIPVPTTLDDKRFSKLVAVTAARRSNGPQVGKKETLELESAVDLIGSGQVDFTNHTINWTSPSDGECASSGCGVRRTGR